MVLHVMSANEDNLKIVDDLKSEDILKDEDNLNKIKLL